MSTQAQAAEARRLAVAAMVTVLDGRYADLPQLLADADHETLVVAVGGVAILAATLAEVTPAEGRTALRAQLADYALEMAGWRRTNVGRGFAVLTGPWGRDVPPGDRRTGTQVIGHAASGSSAAPCGRAVYACRSSLMISV